MNDGDIYVAVETYPQSFIPQECFTGSSSSGTSYQYPLAYFDVYQGGSRLDYKYFLYQYIKPILVTSSTYSAGTTLTINVIFEWMSIPAHRDFTVTVYSK